MKKCDIITCEHKCDIIWDVYDNVFNEHATNIKYICSSCLDDILTVNPNIENELKIRYSTLAIFKK